MTDDDAGTLRAESVFAAAELDEMRNRFRAEREARAAKVRTEASRHALDQSRTVIDKDREVITVMDGDILDTLVAIEADAARGLRAALDKAPEQYDMRLRLGVWALLVALDNPTLGLVHEATEEVRRLVGEPPASPDDASGSQDGLRRPDREADGELAVEMWDLLAELAGPFPDQGVVYRAAARIHRLTDFTAATTQGQPPEAP